MDCGYSGSDTGGDGVADVCGGIVSDPDPHASSSVPAELIKIRYVGKVRAQLVIKSDGSVHEARP
ncbi:hypothetical protein PSFL111601_19485 [Pseudomonas floridensis]